MNFELVPKVGVQPSGVILGNGKNGLRTVAPSKKNTDDHGRTPRLAVEVKDARLSYGRGKKAHHALSGINLRVPEGVIFGLLGASGCGKTTLLNVLNGCLKLNSGKVEVFGVKPGSKYSSVPGRGVGFMPQELALYPDFTIQETLTFFGRLHQMDAKTIKGRSEFLLKFLDLPRRKVFIQDLSGGQQRRVSLAVALIHQPPLLILDEPTVGVDIVLRQTIWEHLVGLANNEGMTIIITTHYIEEASRADIVGLIREGKMLSQNSPKELMLRLEEPTLEKCFLKLCKNNIESEPTVQQETVSNRSLLKRYRFFNKKSAQNENENETPAMKDDSTSDDNPSETDQVPSFTNVLCDNTLNEMEMASQHRASYSIKETFNNIFTLFWKNMLRLKRNIPVLLFQLVLPAFQVVLVCLAVGPQAFGLEVAVVNDENPPEYSQRFLEMMDNHTVIQKAYPNMERAMESVQRGETWAAIYIGNQFSSSFAKRIEDGLYATNSTINSSIIRVYMDLTNRQNALVIQKTLLESFHDFALYMMEVFDTSPLLVELPIKFETPVYGTFQDTYTEFVISGVNMNVAYFMAVALTVMSSISERKSGFLSRNFVSGVTRGQVLSSQMLTQSVVLAGQIMGLFVCTYGIFQISSKGPLLVVIVLFFLQGVFGISYGLLISSVVLDEASAMVIFLGTFYPALLLCGTVWPVEAQPWFLRYISLCLPQTIPTASVRAVMSRGWGIGHTVVWSGMLVMIGWSGICLIAAAGMFKLKK